MIIAKEFVNFPLSTSTPDGITLDEIKQEISKDTTAENHQNGHKPSDTNHNIYHLERNKEKNNLHSKLWSPQIKAKVEVNIETCIP